MLKGLKQSVTQINPPLGQRVSTGRVSLERFRSPKAVSQLSLELSPQLASTLFDRGGERNDKVPSTSGRPPSDVPYVQFPLHQDAVSGPGQQFHMVKVRLHVHYRVHSRQVLCIGGSQLPFGWSFLSIAKYPLAWNPGDVWSTDVRLLAIQSMSHSSLMRDARAAFTLDLKGRSAC